MLGQRILSQLSGTPEMPKGGKAYSVAYAAGQVEGEMILLAGNAARELSDGTLGDVIRRSVFAYYPEATDYTFKEIDYKGLQLQMLGQSMIKGFTEVITADQAQFAINSTNETDR